jgi:iron-sulfur cluster assembly accessory protein
MAMEERTSVETSATAGSPEEPPVHLTVKAVEMVKAAMQRESLGPEHGLRVGVVGGGCSGFSYSMSFDAEQRPDDVVIETGGIRVLIDAASREYLEGTTLDYVSGLHGAGFKFDNPKAQRTCGCGSSFSA